MKTVGRKTERRATRGLYHAETGGSVYFLTFSARPGENFNTAERAIILSSCRFGHPERWILFGGVVMPDHVHMLLKPQLISHENHDFRGANDTIRAPSQPRWMAIGEIVKSIKSITARQINRLRGRKSGPIWMTDYYERNVRDEKDFRVKLEYMMNNPVKGGLVRAPEEWDALWINEEIVSERG